MENKECNEGISNETEKAFYAVQTDRSVEDNKTISDKDIIIKFLNEMSQQDNRMTAWPFFYVIRSSKWLLTEDGYGMDNGIVYVSDDGNYAELSQEEYNALPEDEKDNYTEHHQQKVWEEHGMFLTEKDAELHLKRNHYHYSSDAHTYVKNVYRAPYLEEFITALFNYFNVEPRQYSNKKYEEYKAKRAAEEAIKAKE